MDLLNKDVTLPVPCSECGYEIQQTIRSLEQNPELTCPKCLSVVPVDADELRTALVEAEREAQRLLDAVGKKIEIKLKL